MVPDTRPVPPEREWFARSGLDVARDLLGAVVTRRSPDGDVAVRITEVEAYQGERDPGSHAYRGRTSRNAVMFGEAGHLYTYRHLGLHTCMNIVCGPDGEAAAVLLRAGEVVTGEPVARRRRLAAGTVNQSVDLARGPARLTVALGVTMADYGLDLLDPASPVTLELPASPQLRGVIGGPGPDVGRVAGAGPESRPASCGQAVPDDAVSRGPRVGVSGAGGDGTAFPWRLWITGDPAVSPYRAAARSRSRSGPRSR